MLVVDTSHLPSGLSTSPLVNPCHHKSLRLTLHRGVGDTSLIHGVISFCLAVWISIHHDIHDRESSLPDTSVKSTHLTVDSQPYASPPLPYHHFHIHRTNYRPFIKRAERKVS
ncbi:hypothetical protein Hypma_011266 [Hypsizygus marmoreus]|uniref:Uncharacterized protein n=1 Tax=Hypsizygus marmoreus TaxID=39966 RepID=A0A369JPJ6_HYPMA|nr:hypothetical protein Hypma_011266 [Hypsizygus marmoreus]